MIPVSLALVARVKVVLSVVMGFLLRGCSVRLLCVFDIDVVVPNSAIFSGPLLQSKLLLEQSGERVKELT